ncbi:GNAT family N-acetyltransferase [Streptomyces sp. H27-C3]|uniref:GNAT family N-acetyltransferase n=1 Tax=Streptomyces sp. H27-C3 TaxID=3046305 RepID=UPI0024B8CE45|nr:GNAT family N-acetyltransferase [Streptomyces sp. H27-C3]MDJ0465985.1 GNAT family N-acetyltransferase [Streptomyces sp. H27-C3]
MGYRIRPASTSDVDALMALRTEAEGWLSSVGTDQWSHSEIAGRALERWRATIDDGRSWVVTDDQGAVVATVSRGPADPDFWRASDQPESAFYLYKLIVARSASGNGLGDRILAWADDVAAAEGRTWVRIDCWRTNHGLQKYYVDRGFEYIRTESPSHRKSGWLAQRRAERNSTHDLTERPTEKQHVH